MPDTGHAQAPGGVGGYFPEHLVLAGGGADGISELAAPVELGLFIPSLSLHGAWVLGRPGTALAEGVRIIRGGEPAEPAPNLTVLFEPLELLARVQALTGRQRTIPLPAPRSARTASATVAPALRAAGGDAGGGRGLDDAAMSEREIHSWLMDMDGVLVREEQAIPGAGEFISRLRERGIPFLVLTNNSIFTRRDLAARLLANGLDVPEEAIWTSALATAKFLEDQRPGGSAFVIGEAGLTTALHQAGYTLTERDPDYVLLGETRTYSFERITQAIRLVDRGARFIATNPDVTGPSPDGALPATGAVAALISRATGVDPYFVGKPNPLMMRSALNAIDAHSETTAMIGDRMDTDIVAGLEAGLETILVLTGVTTLADAERYPFRAARIVESVADLLELVG